MNDLDKILLAQASTMTALATLMADPKIADELIRQAETFAAYASRNEKK